jgi:hypothetical protein
MQTHVYIPTGEEVKLRQIFSFDLRVIEKNGVLSIVHYRDLKELLHTTETRERLCNILLGEKVPVRFFTRDKSRVIIPADTKLQKRHLGLLASLWVSGLKFEMDESPLATHLLNALEPDFYWIPV